MAHDPTHHFKLELNSTNATAPMSVTFTALVLVSYSLIFLLGCCGNFLVIFVVLRKKTMYTVTNLFITNLAISDILMCVVAVPFTPMGIFIENWTLPESLCKLLPMTMAVSVYVSTITSLVISIDRYVVIVHPFKRRMSLSTCQIIVSLTWLISVLISVPLANYHTREFDSIKKTFNCQEKWPHPLWKKFYTIASFLMQFILPTMAISYCYYKISRTLQVRCDRKMISGAKSLSRTIHDVKRKKKTNKMLIAMVVIFIICWIPLNGLWITIDIIYKSEQEKIQESAFFVIIFVICHLIAMCSTLYNPFLYGWMNDNFRQEFCLICNCCHIPGVVIIEQNSTFRRNSNEMKEFRRTHLLLNNFVN